MAWWKDFFNGEYRRLWAPFVGGERIEWELEGLSALLEREPQGAAILDVCAGDGRIARPLAALGWPVVACDYSRSMLEHGAARSDGGVAFVRGDARHLPFGPHFDVAMNLFTSFGLFATDAEHGAMVASMAATLRPGGVLFMDLVHRDHLATLSTERTWFELEDGTPVLRTFRFDPVAGRTSERLQTGDGTLLKQWSLRIFTVTDIDRMLRDAGLEPEAYFSGYSLEPFSTDSPRLLAVARKPGVRTEERAPIPLETWTRVAPLCVCPRTGLGLEPDEAPTQLTPARTTRTIPESCTPVERAEQEADPGQPPAQIDGMLRRRDGAVAYPVLGGIPELLAEAAISLNLKPADGPRDEGEDS